MSAMQERTVGDWLQLNVADDSINPEADTQESGTHTKASGIADRFKNAISNMSIGRKITWLSGVYLALTMIGALFIMSGFMRIAEGVEAIGETQQHSVAAERLRTELVEAQRRAEVLAMGGDGALAQTAQRHLGSAKAKLTDLRRSRLASDTQALPRIERVEGAIDVLQQRLIAFGDGDGQTRSDTRKEQLFASGEAALKASASLTDLLAEREGNISLSTSELLSRLMTILMVLGIALVALVIIAQRYVERNFGEPLRQMSLQMTKLSSGQNDIEVLGLERGDEIGAMARAMAVFHKAGVKLAKFAEKRAERAAEELEKQNRLQEREEAARLERKQALRNIADQFERTVGEVVGGVASASSQLQSTSTLMASTAEQSSQRTTEVAVSIDEANAGATAAAAASDEFAMSIGEISRQAATSAQLARKATDSAKEADTTISALSDSAQQVGQIVELIQTIAQRTNLLALNASIEAARGGEAGRGFAVVASEVKELAMQTSRATEQIAEQIRAMQDTTGASVNALRTIASEVEQLETTAVSIATAVDQQSVAGKDLAQSIDLAARGTEQVSGHIQEVRELSVSTGSAASQVLLSSTALEEQAATLRMQVDNFLREVREG